MNRTVGIIDCGTNTFNLLIAEVRPNGRWYKLMSTKIPVKLAPSPTTGKIGLNRFGRGVDALYILRHNLINFGVTEAYALATSAIREAVNGREFTAFVEAHLGLEVRVITGLEEAMLIYGGVKQCVEFGKEAALIMDIGGGSVEFILADVTGVLWKESFEIGVSRLKGKFMPADPIEPAQRDAVVEFIDDQLPSLKAALVAHQPSRLLGSSGTFDSLVDLLDVKFPGCYPHPLPRANEIDLQDYHALSEALKASTLRERLAMEGLLPMRADMIVLSVLLIDTVLNLHPFASVSQVAYSLKEGALLDLIERPQSRE